MILVVKGVAKISKKGSTVVVSVPKRDAEGNVVWETQSIPLLDLDLLAMVGSRIRLSSGVALMLAEANIPVLIHSKRSNCILTNPFDVRVAEVRKRLYRLSDNIEWRIHIGKVFIEGKLSGFANVIRYLAYKEVERGEDAKWVLEEIDNINKLREVETSNIRSIEDLRLYEARWSKRLWELLATFIPNEYGFTGRDPKSRDPMNSAISYAYAIIYGLCTHALIASGLDPYVGIIHSERAGRTSLTYDFSEMFKPLAIHAVTVASRVAKLDVDKSGYLTKSSLEIVTRTLYKALKRKHKSWRYTAKGEVYAKAWELRQNIEKGTTFRPFIYVVK